MGIVIEDAPCPDVEDPSIHLERSGVEPARHEVERAEVLELDEHVLFYRGDYPRLASEVAIAFLDEARDAPRLGEPTRHVRQVLDALGMKDGVDRSAVRVATHYHMADLEHLDGVFDRGRHAAEHASAHGGHDIADIPHDEQLAWGGARDEGRHDTRVAAGDKERLRALAGDGGSKRPRFDAK